MTLFYGLTPVDIDAMTPREIEEYLIYRQRALATQPDDELTV